MNSVEQNNNSAKIAIYFLIAVNALFYIAVSMNPEITNEFALYNSVNHFRLIQILTAAFLHQDFFHLFFNMWGVFLFGSIIFPRIGNRGIVILYLFGAITGNLLFMLFNFGNCTYLLGASGAVCALMSAAALLEPDRKLVFIFLPNRPMKILTVVIVYTILELLLTFDNLNDGIAHLAHLGGFLGGLIAVMLFYRNKGARPIFKKTKNAMEDACENNDDLISPEKFNELLEKLAREGINALTEEEIQQIRKVREEILKP